MNTKPLQIFRSDFIRRLQPTAGPGLLIDAISMRTILNQGDTNDLLVLDLKKNGKPHKRNSCLFPKVGACGSDCVCYNIKDLSEFLDSGAISITFYLAVKNGVADIIFSVQFADASKEKYFSTEDKKYTRSKLQIDKNIARGIAIAHSIRQEVFQEYLDNFWGDDIIPEPLIILWSVLRDTIKGDDPNKNYIVKMEWNDMDRSSNTLDITLLDDTSENKDAETRYSAPLFYGINYLPGDEEDNVVEFRFYKGWSDTASLTILIEAVYKTGLRQFFDLSNEQP